MKDIVAENYLLEIVFPTFASDFDMRIPFSVDNVEDSTFFGILDFIGRPVK